MKSILYIGMDVHKNSFSLCAIKDSASNVVSEIKTGASAMQVVKFINGVKTRLHTNDDEIEIITGYEAGCLGYSLYKQLTALEIPCVILAPTTMQNSAKGKVTKNDRMDALNIAKNLQSGSYKSVYVPDEVDSNLKNFIRMKEDFKKARKIVMQQINALVLRSGYRWEGSSSWTEARIKWYKELEMDDLLKETLNEYLSEYESLTEKINRFKAKLEKIAQEERYNQQVSQLRCFKGIDTESAMTIVAEISDFNRFPNAKAFASYLGLVPGEHSSGDKTNRIPITKQGNSVVRKTLIECAQALVKGKVGQKGKALKARQRDQKVEVIDYADKGVERMQKKFNKMIYRGVNRNVAVTAIARELACFVWGMETGHINNCVIEMEPSD